MGHSANFARLAAASAVAGFLAFVGPSATAQTAGAKPADATDAGRKSLDAGAKSLAAGKYQPAVDQLSTALRGGLAGPDMAKALYLRGLAYKKQGKPGLAISDLTSALWLKNGLNSDDRKHATAERAEAYSMAGLGDGTSGGSERIAVADPNKTPPDTAPPGPAPVAAAPAAPVAAPPADDAIAQVTRQAPQSTAAQEAANARRIAAMPVEAGGLQSAATATLISRPNSTLAAETAPSAPVSAPFQIATAEPAASTPTLSALPTDNSANSPAPASPMSSIGGFFSNIFSGNTSQPSTDVHSVTTASTSAHDPQISSWSNATSVGEPGKATKSAAKEPPAAAKKSAKKGKYKLHIAAVRSRADADALAQKLTSQHAAELGDHVPTVDEAVIGSMGTFYRVRVGGYASQEEPRGLCNKLRTSGFDCLVVTN